MAPILSVLCCLMSWVGAFPSHRGRAKLPMPATVHRGRDIPVRTKSVPYLASGDDLPSVVSALSGMISAAYTTFPKFKNSLERLLLDLPNAMATFPPLKNYVPQSLYVGMIRDVYNSSLPFGHDSYTVVAGAKGGGKTTVVQQMLNGKSGVLFVDVSEADSEKTILDKLLDTTCEPVEGVKKLGLGVLSPFFLAAAEKADGRRITVVLEVERGTASDGVLYMVKSSAKKLACFANVIVVLSEANAALMFGDDKRQDFIWMDGMTNDEATEYAKKVFPAAPDRDLNLFFDKVGIIPYIPFELPHANHTPHNTHLTFVLRARFFLPYRWAPFRSISGFSRRRWGKRYRRMTLSRRPCVRPRETWLYSFISRFSRR